MRYIIMIIFVNTCLAGYVKGQELYFTRTGHIEFHSGTSLEDIDAANNEVTSILNTRTGEIAFTVLIKSFHFRRALMEEHFNENYMESTKFPKSTFKGKIMNLSAIDFSKDGQYPARIEGEMFIHGVTNKLVVNATVTIRDKKITGTSRFRIKPGDYNIKIPGVVADKISKEAEVVINCQYEPRN